MKILHLSTAETIGGAALAANRLHKGLQKAGIQSRMLVYLKKTDDWSVYGPKTKLDKYLYHWNTIYNSIPVLFYTSRKQTLFSPAVTTNADISIINEFNPDIVHVHWIGKGFFSIKSLKKIGKPILWTLHDMWPFTGGCHYDEGCGKYETTCGACPQLGSHRLHDLSYKILGQKARNWKDIGITIVTPSNWLAGCARNSSLFRNNDIHVVPNGLDLEIYKPMNKETARQLWSLSPEKKYILFGAVKATDDRRKGFYILSQALKLLAEISRDKSIELIIFGATEPEISVNYDFKVHFMGELHDDVSLVSLYSAVDVFVAPSQQDNLPNTVIESMSCSVPVVAFEVGGMPDMIDHMVNGYLALPFSPDDMAYGINWVLEDSERHQQLSGSALTKVKNTFDLQRSIEQYEHLYQILL